MSYFGIKRPTIGVAACASRVEAKHIFCNTGEDFKSVGTKILQSLETGADIGDRIPATYDDEDANGVDIMCSPNTDIFDIAEEIGIQAAQQAQEQSSGRKSEESSESEENV